MLQKLADMIDNFAINLKHAPQVSPQPQPTSNPVQQVSGFPVPGSNQGPDPASKVVNPGTAFGLRAGRLQSRTIGPISYGVVNKARIAISRTSIAQVAPTVDPNDVMYGVTYGR